MDSKNNIIHSKKMEYNTNYIVHKSKYLSSKKIFPDFTKDKIYLPQFVKLYYEKLTFHLNQLGFLMDVNLKNLCFIEFVIIYFLVNDVYRYFIITKDFYNQNLNNVINEFISTCNYVTMTFIKKINNIHIENIKFCKNIGIIDPELRNEIIKRPFNMLIHNLLNLCNIKNIKLNMNNITSDNNSTSDDDSEENIEDDDIINFGNCYNWNKLINTKEEMKI